MAIKERQMFFQAMSRKGAKYPEIKYALDLAEKIARGGCQLKWCGIKVPVRGVNRPMKERRFIYYGR